METYTTAAFIMPHPPLIIPDVGHGQESKIAATTAACEEIGRRIAALKPETIVLISPHSISYADYFHISPGASASGNMSAFMAPQFSIKVKYDAELVKAISVEAETDAVPAGTLGERDPALDHGTMVPLYFVNRYLKNYKLVRIGLSGMSPLEHYILGMSITSAAEKLKRRIVIIASGDLSHKLKSDGPYGYANEGPVFDRRITGAMRKGDFLDMLSIPPELAADAGECGLRSFRIMAGALDSRKVKSELLSYEGPFGVGYGTAAFVPDGEDFSRAIGSEFAMLERRRLEAVKASESVLVKFARMSLESYVRDGVRIGVPGDAPDEFTGRRAGVFVSLKRYGELRGCIGTTGPSTKNIVTEVLHNAIEAGSRDPRFPPVNVDELPSLVYSVDVLGDAEAIESEKQLDPKKYGVIVSSGSNRGLLLPDLEGVDTPEQQIAIARRKAGIPANSTVKLARFEVVRYK